MMTEEGDLVLGAPKFDEEGRLLYVKPNGEETADETEGALIRDVQMATNIFAEKQIIYNRLMSSKGDWFLYQNMGASLETLIGQPNTRETGQKGANMIIEALTYDSFLTESELRVRPVPLSATEILFYIEIIKADASFPIPLVLDLEIGVMRKYEV
jgi:hypothetical protein